MSSSHPDSGLPAPAQHEAPLSADEATRLLDSIRQAEGELAETGEQIAVVAVAESASAATESQVSEAATDRADQDVAEVAGSGAAATESESRYDDPTPVFEAAVSAAEEFAAPVVETPAASFVAADVDDAVESPADVASFSSEIVVEVDPDADESAELDTEFVAAEEIDPIQVTGVGSGLILPGDVAGDVETIVHVLRHGEVHNPNGVLYGRLPGFQLSVTGRAQAQAVARSLADHDIALVVASPLQRAQETANPIATGHGLVIRTDDNLIEAGNTFEGLRVTAGALRKPRHWWKLRDPFSPSWGEPYLQIAHRMLAAVNKARVEAAGREAVLVSHQLPVWTLRRFLQGQRLWHDPRNRQCSLASLTSLVYQGDTLIDIVYSEPAGASDPSVTGA
ncbi:hypothetical protein GCM10027262_35660 [Nocardia tengchongensis]